jgi:hypothetical protein
MLTLNPRRGIMMRLMQSMVPTQGRLWRLTNRSRSIAKQDSPNIGGVVVSMHQEAVLDRPPFISTAVGNPGLRVESLLRS